MLICVTERLFKIPVFVEKTRLSELTPPVNAILDVNSSVDTGAANAVKVDNDMTNAIINEVRPYIADGAVVLFHDLYDATANAIEILVPELIQQGYQFVRYDVLEDYMNKKGNN